MKENIADFFLHVLPYWGKEHERIIFHPYLHNQDKRLVLIHPIIEQIFLNEDNGQVKFYPLGEQDFYGRRNVLIENLLKNQALHCWKNGLHESVVYVPKEYIGAFFNYLQWMCKRPATFLGNHLVVGGVKVTTTYFQENYRFPVPDISEKETLFVSCRLYPYHNSSWLHMVAEQAQALVIDMESPIPTRTRWHYETDDGPITLI